MHWLARQVLRLAVVLFCVTLLTFLIVNILLLIIGMIMESLAAILIIAPIITPALVAAGVETFPVVVNHDDSEMGVARKIHEGVFVRSVYFTDPNGIMMELAAFTRPFTPADVRHAPGSARAPAEV